ncbi:MAG: FAD-dependent oxidoreductase, partial [Ferruginibacter sp.]
AMSNEPAEAITEKALSSLAAICDIPEVELKNEVEWTKIFNWQKEEYAMGAYSYGTLLSEKARALINTPLEETIFFAGEALYTGDHPGTVEAALVSGINIADVIRGMGEG